MVKSLQLLYFSN